MKKQTVKSLHKSICHWDRDIAYGLRPENIYGDSCALCKQFHGTDHSHCSDYDGDMCPVAQRTGKVDCRKSPWIDVCDKLRGWNISISGLPKWADEVEAQIEFLISLLPPEEQLRYEPEVPAKPNSAKNRTGIVIDYERIVEQGEQRCKILKLTGLKQDELPKVYVETTGIEWVYISRSGRELRVNSKTFPAMELVNRHQSTGRFGGKTVLSEGETVDSKLFWEVVTYCRKAGNRLAGINRALRIRNKDWHGTDRIVI